MTIGIPITLSRSDLATASAVRPVAFSRNDPASFDEALLQELIDKAPTLLPVQEFYPTTSTICSLGREIPVDLGQKMGYIDNLLVTNDGHLVLVETKLYRNPEAMREVIAQTLQYGMTLARMSLLDLEGQIRKGDKLSERLGRSETIQDRVRNLAEQGLMTGVVDQFEELAEKFQRTGEILLLIVADGIHVAVERISQWLNEQRHSMPLKIGLVELRFYEMQNGERLVVPRTLLRTREISRHVVIVDIRGEGASQATAKVIDEVQTGKGGRDSQERTIKPIGPTMTKAVLLSKLRTEDVAIVTSLCEQLEAIGLDQSGSASYVRYGITYPKEGGEFYPLVYLSPMGLSAYLPKKIIDGLGIQAMVEFRMSLNVVGEFYRPEKIDDPYLGGKTLKYADLLSVMTLVTTIDRVKLRAEAMLKEGKDGG